MEIIKIPDDEKEFKEFCKQWNWNYLGSGRRTWISDLKTYLRGCDYVCSLDDGSYFICDMEDLKELKKTLDKFLKEGNKDER